ncbi:aldose 1-epimerase family protein [Arthrobacter bambusae]|uniref:aldose 1-epimerase family protein n=1 Tax=Arthrobacter bambusae TaxID=1338426 RepID=UPI00277D84E3|nr:aldose 1-epimerase family protein [Arthrobacter bambusae]MDQ0029286.1 aldose 1-epimerase [Arthrobacter bambusae]MDQ0098195.1 aldose 1-epimerase [Arthrobacter bambusae]
MPPTTPSSAPGEETVSRRFASGRQFEIRRGDALAVVTELAAGLRLFSRDGVQLTESYGDAQIPPGATGITLAPWANRIEDGLWYLDGKKQQLDITEVSRNNASHGLLRNSSYSLLAEDEYSVTLEAVIFPQHGYPFLARHRVRYEIDSALALRVSQSFLNDSDAPAPFVLGAHPYLRVGDVPPEEMVLTVHAGTRLVADERKIPRSSVAVDGDFDLGGGRSVGGLDIDVSFTELEFDGGVARHTLSAPDGRSVSVEQDENCAFVHVFVTDTLPGRSKAVALEPMTGPANAFNSGEGLRWLEPGETFTMQWGIVGAL